MKKHAFLSVAALAGMALLQDMFSSVNNRVNGFEHTLARRSKEFRMPSTNSAGHFPHRSGCGPQECARRRRQMARDEPNVYVA